MKKILLLLLVSGFFISAEAQADSLQQYVGKYKFPEGSVVTEVDVTVDANGILMISSAMGSSELKKTGEKDVFELVAYNGLTTFKRSTEGKVNAIKIEVNDLILEGPKVEKPAISLNQQAAK